MNNDDLALEAKDLLAGKERILLDIKPTAGGLYKNVKFFVVLDNKLDFEEEFSTFQEGLYPYGSKFKSYKYKNHDGKTVIMIYAEEVPNQIADRVEEFYDWVVK
jgi:hypothetical protein